MTMAQKHLLSLSVLSLAFLVSVFSAPAYAAKVCATDAFADPSSDPCDVLGYVANNTLTTIAVALLGLVLASQLLQMIVFGGWWMLIMLIGEAAYIAGFVCRYYLHSNPQNAGLFQAEYLLLILAPNAFIAADYVVLSRLSTHIRAPQLLLIRPSRVTFTFITSDIVTFLVQAAGAIIAVAADDSSKKQMGDHIFIAGLILQLISFAFYILCILLFLYRVREREPRVWTVDAAGPIWRDWRALACALLFNCVCIVERCIYRVVEINDGFRGTIATSEKLFYCCDSLLLLLALAAYVFFWPGRFIRGKKHEASNDWTSLKPVNK